VPISSANTVILLQFSHIRVWAHNLILQKKRETSTDYPFL